MLRGAVLRGKGQHIVNYRDCAVNCAKTVEPIEMLFGMWTPVGLSMHVLDGMHIGTTWRIQLNPTVCIGDVALGARCIVLRRSVCLDAEVHSCTWLFEINEVATHKKIEFCSK